MKRFTNQQVSTRTAALLCTCATTKFPRNVPKAGNKASRTDYCPAHRLAITNSVWLPNELTKNLIHLPQPSSALLGSHRYGNGR